MPFIKTYTKGGLLSETLNPNNDIVISVTDFANKPIKFKNPKVATCHLQFDDMLDISLSKTERFFADRIKILKHIELFHKIFGSGWPYMPFTHYHAEKIIEFTVLRNRDFNKNWHIHCEYGRSRSASLAIFLKQIYPNHELILKRDVSSPNPRVLRILNKHYGFQ